MQHTLVAASKKRQAEHAEQVARQLAKAKAAAAEQKARAGSVVYYMRVGNRVKIGYSANLARRAAAVMAEEVLATEPGGRALEEVRHLEFADLRVTHEWFRHEGRLSEHIEKLRRRSSCAT